MMKKVLFSLILLLVASSLFAEPYQNVRAITLQAGYHEVLNVRVQRIPSQSESYLQGMPFNIDDSQVNSSEGDGRLIANWSLLSNTDFKLTFVLEPLRHNTDTTRETYSLPYILSFAYKLSRGIDMSEDEINAYNSQFVLNMASTGMHSSGAFNVSAPTSGDNGQKTFEVTLVDGLTLEGHTDNQFFGTAEGGVYFKFTPESISALKASDSLEKYPAGNYTATVKIYMEAIQ